MRRGRGLHPTVVERLRCADCGAVSPECRSYPEVCHRAVREGWLVGVSWSLCPVCRRKAAEAPVERKAS